VVSEAFNSNSMNIVAGLLLPAALLEASPARRRRLSAVWALVMTMAVVAMLLRRRGCAVPRRCW
jgi:hypothetical protein